jgi:MYXO-CTERM domain-containing protein
MRFTGKLLGVGSLFAAASLAGAGGAGAAEINFEDRQRGEIVDDQYEVPYGVSISAVNDEGGPDEAIIFRAIDYDPSTENEGPSADLRPPFEGGNLADGQSNPEDRDPNKVLIIARNITDNGPNGGNGLVDFPEASRVGSIAFDFVVPQQSFGFDIIDVDDENLFSLEFSLAGSDPVVVSFAEFITPGSEFYDESILFENNTINQIRPLTSDQLGTAFDRVVFNIGDRAALDRINFEPVVVPEPGTAAIAALGLAGLHLATGRRRRNR